MFNMRAWKANVREFARRRVYSLIQRSDCLRKKMDELARREERLALGGMTTILYKHMTWEFNLDRRPVRGRDDVDVCEHFEWQEEYVLEVIRAIVVEGFDRRGLRVLFNPRELGEMDECLNNHEFLASLYASKGFHLVPRT